MLKVAGDLHHKTRADKYIVADPVIGKVAARVYFKEIKLS